MTHIVLEIDCFSPVLMSSALVFRHQFKVARFVMRYRPTPGGENIIVTLYLSQNVPI